MGWVFSVFLNFFEIARQAGSPASCGGAVVFMGDYLVMKNALRRAGGQVSRVHPIPPAAGPISAAAGTAARQGDSTVEIETDKGRPRRALALLQLFEEPGGEGRGYLGGRWRQKTPGVARGANQRGRSDGGLARGPFRADYRRLEGTADAFPENMDVYLWRLYEHALLAHGPSRVSRLARGGSGSGSSIVNSSATAAMGSLFAAVLRGPRDAPPIAPHGSP